MEKENYTYHDCSVNEQQFNWGLFFSSSCPKFTNWQCVDTSTFAFTIQDAKGWLYLENIYPSRACRKQHINLETGNVHNVHEFQLWRKNKTYISPNQFLQCKRIHDPDFTRGYISPIKHSISSLESARCLFSWVMNGHKSSVYIRGCGDLAIINEFHCYQGRLYGGSMFTKFPYLSSEYFKAFYIMHVYAFGALNGGV